MMMVIKGKLKKAFCMCLAVVSVMALSAVSFATGSSGSIDYSGISDALSSGISDATTTAIGMLGPVITASIGILAVILGIRLAMYVYRRITAARG